MYTIVYNKRSWNGISVYNYSLIPWVTIIQFAVLVLVIKTKGVFL